MEDKAMRLLFGIFFDYATLWQTDKEEFGRIMEEVHLPAFRKINHSSQLHEPFPLSGEPEKAPF